jgi:hypothetical protein
LRLIRDNLRDLRQAGLATMRVIKEKLNPNDNT